MKYTRPFSLLSLPQKLKSEVGEAWQRLGTKFRELLNCHNTYPQLPSSALALRNKPEGPRAPPCTEQPRFPRPPLAPMTSKGSPKTSSHPPAFPPVCPYSLPGQSTKQDLGTKGYTRLPREENLITWNSANSSQFTPSLGAAILDDGEDPAAGQSPWSGGVRGAA